MKHLLIICLILLGVTVQAQTWSPESFGKMARNAGVVGLPNDAVSTQKYLDESMKNCFVYPANPVRDKEGNVPAKKVNLWVPKEFTGGYLSKWNYVVTVDLVWGNTPSEIEHPDSPVKADPCGVVSKEGKQPTTLVNCTHLVPQSELIQKATHKFYRPTYAQYKKLTRVQQDWVDRGGLIIGKITKAELKALGEVSK